MKLCTLTLALLLWLLPVSAFSDTSHCNPASSVDPGSRIDVYLNDQSFDDFIYDENGTLGGLTLDEVLGAMLQAMEQWNHSAAGVEFRYMGTTSLVRGGCGFGVVRGGKLSSGSIVSKENAQATLIGECSGDGFSLEIPAKFNSTTPIRWVTGDPTGVYGSREDLVAIFTHEFGHATGVGHPLRENAHGVMNSNNKRDLYQIDIECARHYHYIAGNSRVLDLRQIAFTSGATTTTTLGYSQNWAGAPGVSAGGAAGGPDEFRGSWTGAFGPRAEKYSSGVVHLDSWQYDTHSPQPPIRIHRRDIQPQYRDAIIYQNLNAAYYGEQTNEKFLQRVYVSPDGFDPSSEYNYQPYNALLKHCVSPYGFFPMQDCSVNEPVFSGHRVSMAYDTSVDRSVYAWTKQDRSNLSVHNTLNVSIGTYDGSYYDSTVIGKAFSAGVRSDVAPSVACKTGAAGSAGYDCMVAYTDVSDPKNTIRFKRFSPAAVSSYYAPSFESGYQQIDSSGWHRTASPVALFHHYGKWWIAFKLALATGSGGVRLYSSSTGDTGTWTLHSSTGYTATGATAIGDWTVSNRVWWSQ